MAPLDVLERATDVGGRVLRGSRISVTELSRGTDWRKELPSAGVIEVTDRGDTAAWLVSDDDMRALVNGFALLEEELERAQIAAIFNTRAEAQPLSGLELKEAARTAFKVRKSELAGAVNGDER